MVKVLKTTPKISVKIWKPIIKKLDAKLKSSCLRRDAYLTKLLEVELDYLEAEVPIPNSQESYDYVFETFEGFDHKPVSLALPQGLTSRLSEICSRKRIVRDAFFNRVFLLLSVDPKFVDTLFFAGVDGDWRKHVWHEYKSESQFFQSGFYPLEQVVDPFWAIRAAFDLYAQDEVFEDHLESSSGKAVRVKRDFAGAPVVADSLYATVFTQKVRGNDLIALSCYLPDWAIPGHDAKKKRTGMIDEIMGELGGLS